MTENRSLPLERAPAWSRVFRIVSCLCALFFFFEPYVVGGFRSDSFGGHYRFLTRWNFTLNTGIACWALIGEWRRDFSIHPLVASVALP